MSPGYFSIQKLYFLQNAQNSNPKRYIYAQLVHKMERILCFSLQKEEIFYDPNAIAAHLLLIRKIAGSSCSGSTATLRLISNTAINIKAANSADVLASLKVFKI